MVRQGARRRSKARIRRHEKRSRLVHKELLEKQDQFSVNSLIPSPHTVWLILRVVSYLGLFLLCFSVLFYLHVAHRQPQIPFYQEQWGASEVIPGLYLGNSTDFFNLAQLKNHNISNAVSIITGIDPVYPDELNHTIVRAFDYPDQDLYTVFVDVYNIIAPILARNESVLVHCMVGQSRSAAMTAAFLMQHFNISSVRAMTRLKKARPLVSPRPAFLRQLDLLDYNRTSNAKAAIKAGEVALELREYPRKPYIRQWFDGKAYTKSYYDTSGMTWDDYWYSWFLVIHTFIFHHYLRCWYMFGYY